MSAFIHIALTAFAVILSTCISAQDLFMHRNIRRAYELGTRAYDGKPGPGYWQNHASYRIDVTVDIPSRLVSGNSLIRYFNESPDTLTMIRLKLAHDLFRKNGQRAYDLSADDITDGVAISNLMVRNQSIPSDKVQQASTFFDIHLDEPLPPGQNITISLDWSHKAPSGRAPREGVYDTSTWFMAYWYPQVAVYDDLHGWASAPYNGMQEMYNDFSDYEVRITVPGNCMVWATGVWENAPEILAPEFLARYEKALSSSAVVRIFSPEDYAAGAAFFKKADTHTFRFKARDVPDFAFAFSDRYLWDAAMALVDPTTGRKALAAAAYNPESKDFYEVSRITADALELMSSWLPGYPYPYPCMTVFNGRGGMEFPMMCNDGSTHPRSPISLTVHETSHTYFPFMMGINEQYYAWMDEGWAAFFDVLITDSLAGNPSGRMRNYPSQAGTDQDMPPMTPSRELSTGYRVAAYNRAQAAYMTLYQLLGYERFHHCMIDYMNRWKGKHPQPFDFFHTWNEASGENLNWFWKPWFFDWGFPDLAVAGVDQRGILVENTGTMPMTVVATVRYTDGSEEVFRRTAEVWRSEERQIHIPTAEGKTVREVVLGDRLVSDTVKENNTWIRKE